MLRTIRLTAAIVCFTLITLLFLDFTGTLHTWFGWLAKIQFLPAVYKLQKVIPILLIRIFFNSGLLYHNYRKSLYIRVSVIQNISLGNGRSE